MPAKKRAAGRKSRSGASPRSRRSRGVSAPPHLDDDPMWYKEAVVYQLHVKAFRDSDGDGIGDFRGLTEKLDYLRDLGVTALWLLPFYPSPLRDDGYDIADYTDVHPDYGTLADFKVFLQEAHARGLRVITELVVNHTSDQHPWFQRARRASPGSPERDFYVWSDTPERYREARIIFKDFEPSNWTWDPLAKAYYWHRFYNHQPDLNFDNPKVHEAVLGWLDFWLGMGVDGLRLDAVPYLYEREGSNCENLPETHAFLRKMRAYVDEKYPGRMLLAEANQWPEDAVAYFGRGKGDECHAAFHFPLMPRLFMALRTEDRFPILDILDQTPAIPETSQWFVFLRNHDELTLEMVTDEERDYLWRVYAHDPRARINLGIRRRLAPLLGNDRRRIELMDALLCSMPGTPVLYYGDELGMGDNIYLGDRNGVRTPMQWSPDRNAGFSSANPQKLYLPAITDPEFHHESVNVEAQMANPHSLLWWTRRLIALRKRHPAFGRGDLTFLHPDNRKVLAFVRSVPEERVLVVANLSRFVQVVDLDMEGFDDVVPVELFGGTTFPRVPGDRPYTLTLGPHAFYWLGLPLARPRTELEPVAGPGIPMPSTAPSGAEATHAGPHAPGGDGKAGPAGPPLPVVTLPGHDWRAVFRRGKARTALEDAVPRFLAGQRWFRAKARRVKGAELTDAVAMGHHADAVHLSLVEVEFTEGEPQTYVLPLARATRGHASRIREEHPRSVVAELRGKAGDDLGLLYDALVEPGFCENLLASIARRKHHNGGAGTVVGEPTAAFRKLRGPASQPLEVTPMRAEQSNTSVVFGDRLVLKLFRVVEEGENPDLEVGRFLTERTRFRHAPQVAGALTYERRRQPPLTLGILQEYVPNQGDAWKSTLDALSRYVERAVAKVSAGEAPSTTGGHVLDLAGTEPPAEARETLGLYLDTARLLGQRTAELHLALASRGEETGFAPEPVTGFYQRSLYQHMRTQNHEVLPLLRKRLRDLPEPARADTDRLLGMADRMEARFKAVLDGKVDAVRIRTHGDYHLGQVLATGNDFVILDFEGEPARPLSERRLRRIALRDVAGMLRSFDYARHAALQRALEAGVVPRERMPEVEPWMRLWYRWVAATFLGAYLPMVREARLVPADPGQVRALLDALLLEKAVYEVGYELNNRPAWVHVPLRGVRELLEEPATPSPRGTAG